MCVCVSLFVCVCGGDVFRGEKWMQGGQQYIECEELLESNRKTVLSPVDLQNNNKNMKQKKYRITLDISFSKYKQI